MQHDLHNEDDDLQEIAPLLSKIQKKELKAPDGYFEQFPRMIMIEIAKEKSNKNWLSIAATIIILLGIGFALHSFDHQSKELKIASESTNIADEYLYEIDEQVLIEFVSATKQVEKKSEKLDELLIETYSEEDLLEHYN